MSDELSPTTIVSVPAVGPAETAGKTLSEADYDDLQAILSWWRSRQGQKDRAHENRERSEG